MVVFIFFSLNCYSSDQARTYSQNKIRWYDNSTNIKIVPNSSDLSSSVAETIIRSSITEWNRYSPMRISVSSDSLNKISFSDDPRYFGPGVLAVTVVGYAPNTGEISGANIYLNQTDFSERTFSFISDPSSVDTTNYYLGDVVTHELGHFLGLSHSEVLDSSMVWTAFRGQSTLSQEDKAAIRGIYKPNLYAEIHGIVAGGTSVPIFGAHVQVISITTGKVAGAAFSQDDGSFLIGGLDEDRYLIYVSPMDGIEKSQSLYLSVEKNFCPGEYVGEFFQGCSTASRGKPQVIALDSLESKNVGTISIRCQGRFDSDYTAEKFSSDSLSNTMDSIVEFHPQRGFFINGVANVTDTDIYERIIFDLTHEDLDPLISYELELDLNSEIFGSPLGWHVQVSGDSGTLNFYSSYDSLGKLNNNLRINYPLSTNPADNLITVKLYPRLLDSVEQILTFPAESLFSNDDLNFIIIPKIKTTTDEIVKYPETTATEDEQLCLDAPYSFAVEAYKDAALLEQENSSNDFEEDQASEVKQAPLACGSIGGGDAPGGGGGFLMGIILSFILGKLSHIRWKNLLSRLTE